MAKLSELTSTTLLDTGDDMYAVQGGASKRSQIGSINSTGTGAFARATSPTLVTPVIGAATGTSLVLTGTGASIIAAGANGATNPVVKIDASAASVATGISITGAAAASRAALAVISSGANEGLSIDAKGSGTIRLGATSTGAVEFSRNAVPTASDGAALGTTALMWSDLFLASGGVVNFANGTVTLTHSGSAVVVAASTATSLVLNKTSGSGTYVALHGQSNGSLRWLFNFADQIAESGSNAGSNFRLSRYSDAGGYLSDPLLITRSSGNATFGHDVAISGTTASTSTATGALVVSGGVGIAGAVYTGGAVNISPTTDSVDKILWWDDGVNFKGGITKSTGNVGAFFVKGNSTAFKIQGVSTYGGTLADIMTFNTSTLTALAVAPTGGLGYGTGAGGTVTQATSRTTGVTINKVCGAITLVSAAGTTSWQTFTVTNSAVAATDTIKVDQKSGTDLNEIHVTAVAAGSFNISFRTTGGTTTEQPVFNFAVLKAVTS